MSCLVDRSSARAAGITRRRRRAALAFGAFGAVGAAAVLMLTAGVFSHGGVGGARSQRQLGHPAFAHIRSRLGAQFRRRWAASSPAIGWWGCGRGTRRSASAPSSRARARASSQGRPAFGSDSSAMAVGARSASPVGRSASVGEPGDYPRRGVDEWYANGPLGLEQGFDVSARPRRPGSR